MKFATPFFKKFFFFALFAFALTLPKIIFAANIIMSSSAGTVEQGKTFTVTVYVASPTTSINAASGTISYPPELISLEGTSKAASIVSEWLPPGSEGPKATRGTIHFEGVSLAGYQGQKGKLFSATFKMIGTGDATIAIPSSFILANDGLGTNVTQPGRGVTVTGTKPVVPEKTPEEPVVVPEPILEPEVVPVVEEPAPAPVEMAPAPAQKLSWIDQFALSLLNTNLWLIILLAVLCLGIFLICILLLRIERKIAYLESMLPPPRAPRKPRTSKKVIEVVRD